MGTFRGMVAGFLLVCAVGQSASAGPILMPAGSTVWMKFESSVAPAADGNDAAGSNLPGQAPPNGIPMTTVTNSNPGYASGYAEIMPNSVRTFLQANFTSFLHASFQDTYTVTGTATGTFDIPVSLRVTGTMRSQPHGVFGHILWSATVQAEIGTFNPDPGIGEGNRITPFNPSTFTQAEFIGPDARPNPYEVPVDITTNYTVQGVSVGDTFVLAYGVNSAFAKGEIDLRNTGAISFVLPAGVTLTSSLAQAIPEPNALALLAACLALTARRRQRDNRLTA
jgi:hypothetical protein